MKVFDAAAIRNVALVGHSGGGKTQLASALLFDASAASRFGKVDEGTTVTDYDDEAIARKHTLSASLAFFEWNRCKVNLIDTPGMGNFLGETRAALRVVEAAVVVVDAVSGVQVSTEKAWEAAEEQHLPRLIVCNRLDRERASLDRALESMHGALGRNCVPVQLPIGEEKSFLRGRRPRRAEGVHVRRRRIRKDDRRARARGPRSGRGSRTHRAHRDGGRSRRRADGEVFRGRNADAGGAHRRVEPGRTRRQALPGVLCRGAS